MEILDKKSRPLKSMICKYHYDVSTKKRIFTRVLNQYCKKRFPNLTLYYDYYDDNFDSYFSIKCPEETEIFKIVICDCCKGICIDVIPQISFSDNHPLHKTVHINTMEDLHFILQSVL